MTYGLDNMDGLTVTESAKLLLPIAKKVWPHTRRIYRERRAGTLVLEGSDLLDKEFQKTLNRITGGNIDEAWWQKLLDKIEQPLILPEFLKISAVQEWLRDVDVQTHLKAIAHACVMGSKNCDKKSYPVLRSKYSGKTGEHERYANLPIKVVVSILVAGFLSSIPEPSRSVAAMVQAGAEENRANFEEVRQTVKQLGADSFVVKAHNEEAAKNLSIILKKKRIRFGVNK